MAMRNPILTKTNLLISFAAMAYVLTGCSHDNLRKLEGANAATPTEIGAGEKRDLDNHRVIKLSPEAVDYAHLKMAVVGSCSMKANVETTGEVQADANLVTHINAPVNGKIAKVLVSVGDFVHENAPVFLVRSSDVEATEAELLQNEAQIKSDLKRDLLQIDSDLAKEKAQLALSQKTFERIKSLVDEKIASKADYESASTQLDKDTIELGALNRKRDATINLSKERLRLITEPLKQKLHLMGVSDAQIAGLLRTGQIDAAIEVVAPASGVVCERSVNVGEQVDTSKSLITLGNFSKVWLKADVHEKDIEKLSLGEPIELHVDGLPGRTFSGRLDYLSDSVNADTRTLTVRAEVANPNNLLRPNMFARMVINVGDKSVMAIPKTAVQIAGSDSVVYVAQQKNQFEERPVRLGPDNAGNVQVISGLQKGEKIVTDGSFILRSKSCREDD